MRTCMSPSLQEPVVVVGLCQGGLVGVREVKVVNGHRGAWEAFIF